MRQYHHQRHYCRAENIPRIHAQHKTTKIVKITKQYHSTPKTQASKLFIRNCSKIRLQWTAGCAETVTQYSLQKTICVECVSGFRDLC